MEELLYMTGSLAALAVLATQISLLVGRRPSRGDLHDSRYQELTQRLEEEKREMWGEIRELREHLGAAVDDLHERIDFTERMLTQGRPAEEPREPTPV